MRSYLERGYTVVKMKIGGADLAEDQRRIEAVLDEIGDEGQLAVDANGLFDLKLRSSMPKCSGNIRSFGTRRQAIRSTMLCRQR